MAADTLPAVAPETMARVREWGLLLRGMVTSKRRTIAMTATFVTETNEILRVSFHRGGGATLRVGERTLTLPDEWLDGAATTDGRGDPS
jgi:hypothetical protein